ncbi:MAG: carbohydrate ABC transporter permease [Chloroflexi bacterium]|nr:carbohydrate ABC transporter permease [Chloroflexota bacterium]
MTDQTRTLDVSTPRRPFSPADRRRLLNIAVFALFACYSVITLFPFYVLFVRSFVSTTDSADLHLWIPETDEVDLRAQFGNLTVFLNLDPAKVKEDLGIPANDYIHPRYTLQNVADKYDIPEEEMKDYFYKYKRYNGWLVLLNEQELRPTLLRTLAITVASLMGINVLASLTGYGLGGLRRRDQRLVYGLYLLQMVLPPMLILLPQYMIIKAIFGIVPDYDQPGTARHLAQAVAIIAINIKGGALSTMIYTAYISQLPSDLEDAAMVDGATRWQYYRYVLLPLMKVPAATLSVIMLPVFWNQFLEPYVYLDPNNSTMLPFIQKFAGQYSTNFQVIFSAILVSVVPLVVVYIIFRRFFIRGVLSGAVKG